MKGDVRKNDNAVTLERTGGLDAIDGVAATESPNCIALFPPGGLDTHTHTSQRIEVPPSPRMHSHHDKTNHLETLDEARIRSGHVEPHPSPSPRANTTKAARPRPSCQILPTILKHQYRRIVGFDSDGGTVSVRAETVGCPRIKYGIGPVGVQVRHLAKVHRHVPRLAEGVEQPDKGPSPTRPGPVLRREGLVPRPVRKMAPFVRHGRRAVHGVLVERDEVLVARRS